jgi:hypothetical protein
MKNETVQYGIPDMTANWMVAVKNDPFLGWNSKDQKIQEESRKLFKQQPTSYHHSLIRTGYKLWKEKSMAETHSCESGGMQSQKVMAMSGTTLVVGESKYQTVPMVHDDDVSMDPSDEHAAAVAAMLLRDNKGVIESVMNTSVIDKGPLKTFMTGESYQDYAYSVSMILTDVGAKGKGDQFQRSVYRGIAEATKEVRTILRLKTYRLMAPQKITVRPKEREVSWNDANATFSVSKGIDTIKEPQPNGTVKIVHVPRLLPGMLKGTALSIEKGKKERYPPAQLADYITSHFPPTIVKYYGLRMASDKTQRLFMAIRPFLEAAVIVSPTPGLRRWLVENNLESRVRTMSNAFIKGTLEDGDLQLVLHNYEKGQQMIKKTVENATDSIDYVDDVIFYGKVTFDRDFFTQFKILCYQPSPQGNWAYCPSEMALKLPDVFNGQKLQVITNATQMLGLLSTLVRSLTTGVFQGHYCPNGKAYADLKYPITQKDYEKVDLDGETYVRETAVGHKGDQQQEAVHKIDGDWGDESEEDAPLMPVGRKNKESVADKFPRLLAPEEKVWDEDCDANARNTGEWVNYTPMSEYSKDCVVLPTGQGTAIKGELDAWLYAGVEYVALYDIPGGHLVVSRSLFDELNLKCLVADE